MVESDLVYYWLGTTSVNLVLLACLLFGWLGEVIQSYNWILETTINELILKLAYSVRKYLFLVSIKDALHKISQAFN